MVAGGALLGTLGVFAEEAGQDPFTTVWFRCAFGLLALTLFGAALRRLPELRLARASWLPVLGVAVLTLVNWVMFFASITRTSIGVATVVVHMQPLWVLALGAWWLRERVTRTQWLATTVALGGLVLATGLVEPGGDAGPGVSHDYVVGLLMCVVGSFSYACVTLLARSSARQVSPFALTWWQCAIGSLALLAWPLWQGWPPLGAPWAWLAGLGAIHTGLAYVLLYGGMARMPAARVAVLQFVYPATAVLMDALVYGRLLSGVQLVGVLLMGLALWAARRAD